MFFTATVADEDLGELTNSRDGLGGFDTSIVRLRCTSDNYSPSMIDVPYIMEVPCVVVISEDHALLRRWPRLTTQRAWLRGGGAVEDGPSALTSLIGHRPDVAVVDVRLPPTFSNEGLVAAIEARRQCRVCQSWCFLSTSSRSTLVSWLSDGIGGVGYR